MRQLRLGLVLVTLLVLQTTLIAHLPLFGVRADLVLLIAIATGIVGGPDRGAIMGFVAGLGYDLLVSQTPVGLFALTYCLTGYSVGKMQASVMRTSWWIPVASAFGASAAGIAAFALFATLLGEEGFLDDRLGRIALIVAVVNALLILPMLRVLRWSLPLDPRLARLAA